MDEKNNQNVNVPGGIGGGGGGGGAGGGGGISPQIQDKQDKKYNWNKIGAILGGVAIIVAIILWAT